MVGMTNSAIEQAGKLLNTPVASIVATACGADINKARRAVERLLGTSSAVASINTYVDDLSRLRAGLQQLKG